MAIEAGCSDDRGGPVQRSGVRCPAFGGEPLRGCDLLSGKFSGCRRRWRLAAVVLAGWLTLCATAASSARAVDWSIDAVPIPGAPYGELSAVSCSSATACTAVGSMTNSAGVTVPLAERWNGSRWRLQAVPADRRATSSVLAAVSCAPGGPCLAVGSDVTGSGCSSGNSGACFSVPLVEEWSGSRWSIGRLPVLAHAEATSLSAVSCGGPRTCVVVGSFSAVGGRTSALAERWNGAGWSVPRMPRPAHSALSGVSCVSIRDCLAVGHAGRSTLVLRMRGGTWSAQRTPNGLRASLQIPSGGPWLSSSLAAVSCTSTTACVADGYITYGCLGCVGGGGFGYGLTERWNGSSWKVDPNPSWSAGTLGDVGAVSCASASDCFATGGGSNGPLMRWNGARWTVQPSPAPASLIETPLSGVSCPSATLCIAVGSYGLPTASGRTAAWAQRWDGSRWKPADLPNVRSAPLPSQLNGISCLSPRDCTAVGNYVNKADVIATLAERWNGSRWTVEATPNPDVGFEADNSLDGVSCPSPKFCMAVGWFGSRRTLAEAWNGTRWSIITTPKRLDSQGTLTGVSCTTARACTAVGITNGYSALAERWNGSKWTVQSAPNADGQFGAFSGVSCPETTYCMAVGYGSEVWNGSTWTILAMPTAPGNETPILNAVSCNTRMACTAVGPNQLADDWSGTSWTQTSPPPPGLGLVPELKGIWCTYATFCMAVGRLEQLTAGGPLTYAYSWDGMTWTAQAPPTPGGSAELDAVSCTSPSFCIAVGAVHGGVNGAGDSSALAERYS